MLLSREQGSSLIEVLITVLIIAIGLLGFAALQTQALRVNYESLQRSLASSMAEDIFDRIRSNVDDADNYVRDFNDDLPTVAKQCDAVTCIPSEMASWDLRRWMERLQARIPNSDAQITLVNRLLTIEISLIEQTESQFAVRAAEAKLANAADATAAAAAQAELTGLDIGLAESNTFIFYTVL